MSTVSKLSVLSFIFCLCSCSHYTYLPKSAKQKYFARPHIQFMMSVVSFRESTGVWPSSLYQLELHTEKNKQIIEGFQYQSVYFTSKKNDRLLVSFDNYKKQFYLDEDDKVDLNRLRGNILFYKSNDKFVWKVTMQ